MKKILKKLLVFVSALAVLLTAVSTVSAIKLDSYDINNDEYIEFLDKLGKRIECEEEFIETFSDLSSGNLQLKHIYFESETTEFSDDLSCFFEYEIIGSKQRTFIKGRLCFHQLYLGNMPNIEIESFFDNHTIDEVNEFLAENDFKAHYEEKTLESDQSIKYKTLVYDEGSTEEEVMQVVFALNEKYGLQIYYHQYSLMYPSYADETVTPEILSGDANGDNELNVSDCAFIARTLAKRETIDIALNPAADYNNDGKVTVSDAATIARELAKK